MAERELAILVTARDLATRTLRNVNRELDKTGKKIGSIGAKGVGTSVKNIGKLAVAGAAVALVLGTGAVKAAADFESQLNTINTVAQATPAQLEGIGAGIRKIARDTGAPLEELTQGFYDLVSAGVDAAQAQRVLESSNRLAIGGLATAAEGVDLLTTALNSFGVAAQDQGATSERFADIFAKAIEKGKVTAAELASSFATIAPIAAKSGIEIEELAAGYALLTAQGVPAAEAATQMRSALVGLLSPNAKLNAIQKQTGVNFAKLAKEKGLVVALERLRKEAEKADVPLIDILGRVEGFNFAISATGDNLAAYNADLADMGKATGTAARQMSERQQGLNFQIARLKALARDAGITIGSKLLPKLTPLAERAVAFLETHQPDIERFGDEIASAFDRAADFAERIPWAEVGSGLKMAAQFSAGLVDAFTRMPPEAQATIVALAGLNKLSGGAVSGIVGELGKGLIKGVLGMNAGVVNINAGVVRGGGVPGVPGAPGGGGVGSLFKFAGGALVVTGVMAAATEVSGINDPRHRNASGRIFRGTNVASEQLANQENAARALRGRIAGGERGFVEKQLAGVEAEIARLRGAAGSSGSPQRQPFGPTKARPMAAWGQRGPIGQLSPAVATERAAIAEFTASTAPSMKSMEAHLANLKALQATTPARDMTNTAAIVAAIERLGRLINPAAPVVTVTVTAAAVQRATTAWRRTGRGSVVGAW